MTDWVRLVRYVGELRGEMLAKAVRRILIWRNFELARILNHRILQGPIVQNPCGS
jgi:hypothetical protein